MGRDAIVRVLLLSPSVKMALRDGPQSRTERVLRNASGERRRAVAQWISCSTLSVGMLAARVGVTPPSAWTFDRAMKRSRTHPRTRRPATDSRGRSTEHLLGGGKEGRVHAGLIRRNTSGWWRRAVASPSAPRAHSTVRGRRTASRARWPSRPRRATPSAP